MPKPVKVLHSEFVGPVSLRRRLFQVVEYYAVVFIYLGTMESALELPVMMGFETPVPP